MQDIVAEAKKLTKQDFEKLQAKKPETRTMVRVNLEDEEVESEESEPEDILAYFTSLYSFNKLFIVLLLND